MFTELVESVRQELAPVFDMMEWGEDEITQARQRHPDHADTLYHSFSLLNPPMTGSARSSCTAPTLANSSNASPTVPTPAQPPTPR